LVVGLLGVDEGDEGVDLLAPGCGGWAEAVGDGLCEDGGVAGGGKDGRGGFRGEGGAFGLGRSFCGEVGGLAEGFLGGSGALGNGLDAVLEVLDGLREGCAAGQEAEDEGGDEDAAHACAGVSIKAQGP
jgi:hypothetical protein